jgi:branched-subunit amino acid aminotransferase/4-amino-4-deoxychorismate lyase
VFVSCHSRAKGIWSEWSARAEVPPFAAGLQFGLAVFEGMQARLFGGATRFKIQFLADHYQRLCASAALLGIEVPHRDWFETGLIRAIEPLLASAADSSPRSRLYLRSVHFSGCEDIFPRCDFPYFCNIFARVVPQPAQPVPLEVLADRPYFRAPAGSWLGSAKCAVNYTRLVELDTAQLAANQTNQTQRLWLSPEPGHSIEELDTMAIGLMMADGTFCVPPPSRSKLASVTLKNLVQQLTQAGKRVCERATGLEELDDQLCCGAVTGVFAASTGKGLGVVTRIRFAHKVLELTPPAGQVDTLWRAYTHMHEAPGD